jgi:glycosyltransferase involved in cell wall biosynthesis
LRAKLEAQAKQAALGDAFRFLGYRGDMPAFIAALDVYVLPSLWEGLPLALCEALAVGKPVVCTRVGGNAEVILDGQNGEVVPSANADALADAVLRMVRTPHVAAAYRERNRKRFEEHFSLQSMVTAHEELYEQVARPGSASAAWP